MRQSTPTFTLEGEIPAAASLHPAEPDGEGPLRPPGPPSHLSVREGIATVAQASVIVVSRIALCYFARPVMLPLALAWVAGMALRPPVKWLRARKVPSAIAAALMLAAFLLPVGWTAARLSHPAMEWIREVPENVLLLKDRFGHLLQPAQRLQQAAASVGAIGTATESGQPPAKVELNDGQVTKAVFTWTGSVLVLIGESVALLFLLLTAGDAFLLKLVRAVPALHDKRRIVEISHQIQHSVSTYLFSVSLVNIALGLLLGVGFWMAGMPHPMMWGAAAGLLNFIPYFGPIVGLAAVGMSGLLAFDTVSHGLVPFAIYLAVHLVEANAITPMVLGRRCLLNPFVIFLMLLFFTWLWGIPGAFLAVPILVSVKAVCDGVPGLSPVADFLGR